MATIAFKLYRLLGAVWLSRHARPLVRFARSATYIPTIFVIAVLGFVLLVSGPVVLLLEENWSAAAIWFVIGLPVYWLLILLLTSRGRTAAGTMEHRDPPADLLKRCTDMLEQHGFRIQPTAVDSLRVYRGASWSVESEWRDFPIEVSLAVSVSFEASLLSVRCTVGGGAVYRETRELLQSTCTAIAALDASKLTALDKTIVFRQRALFLGGLARTVFNALTIATFVTVLTLSGLIVAVGARLFELSASTTMADAGFSSFLHLLHEMDLPLRTELVSFLSTWPLDRKSPQEVLREFRPQARADHVVMALKRADGTVLLIQPAEGSPLYPLAQALFTAGLAEQGGVIQKVGDRLFKRFGQRYARDLESRLGLIGDRLIGGSFLTYGDLVERAPTSTGMGTATELTIFNRGSSVARYRWTENDVVADEGSSVVPQVVMRATMAAGQQISLLDVIRRPEWADAFRKEERNGGSFWVFYQGLVGESGWSGFSYAVPATVVESGLGTFYLMGFIVALFSFLVILVVADLISLVVSRRISQPVLQIRDALRTIAEGDYSVRVESDRTDEIGQLQKLLNHTAVELRRREAIKDLFGKYLSRQVAERILESDGQAMISGIRREVSVLFADVRGFTTYAERHDPEQVTKSLNEYFEVVVDVIASHDGVLDKYIGDGLMAVFGAPMIQEDHARRAVTTALEMQTALQALNLKRIERGDVPIYIGIGVNTGIAISGNLGSIKRMEFTVIGDTVNLAARLESRAGQGQILIGKATYDNVMDFAECEPLGPVSVKGKTDPVEVWMVKGLKSHTQRSGQ